MMDKSLSIEKAREIIKTQFGLLNVSVPGFTKSEDRIGLNYEVTPNAILNDQIFEITGEICHLDKKEKTISIRDRDNNFYIVLPTSETIYSDSLLDKGEGNSKINGATLSIIGLKAESPNGNSAVYLAITIIREEERSMFDQIKSLYGRAIAIRRFYTWFNEKKRDSICMESQGKKYPKYEFSKDLEFNSLEELALKYFLTKDTYPLETQRAVESYLRDTNTSKQKTEKKLRTLLKISPAYKDRNHVTKEELQTFLDDKLYGMEDVKAQLIDILVSNERVGRRGGAFLLVGSDEARMEAIMQAIAEACGLPYAGKDLGALSNPLEIEGLDSSYEYSDLGWLFEVFSAHQTSEMVIGLKGIDGINRQSKEGDPFKVIAKILEGNFEDKFCGARVCTLNTIFIMTASSVERSIPENLLKNFNAVIHLPDYNTEDKKVIANDHIIPEILNMYHLEDSGLEFPEDVLDYIIKNYCEDQGTCDLYHNIERIVHRFISDSHEDAQGYITIEKVKSVLDPLIKETPALFFARHRDQYDEPVADEIKRSLMEAKKTMGEYSDSFANEKCRERLGYLLACRDEEGDFQDSFEPESFFQTLHKNIFGMENVIKELTLLYHTAHLQGTVLNSNIALCGGYGTGKTTLSQNVARAMGYHFEKISLNGILDIRDLRGTPSTIAGSCPGRIIKGIKRAGSLKTIFLLDEIDKLRPDMAMILLDLLDREFTDEFVGVPVKFKKAIFIATANDWGNVPAVIRDRFIVVNVDGYDRGEKSKIVSDYIIPRIEENYAASSVSVSIEESAKEALLKYYCYGFGVRDAEKAMQKLVSCKLLDQTGKDNATCVRISGCDLKKYLGDKPIPRGNFPQEENLPGIAKALAVSNSNQGNTFAIETVLIDGEETLEMTGLPKETTTDSVKIAVTCIKKMYPGLLTGKQIHVHFGEGGVTKDGSSAGVALFMSILSAAIDKPLMVSKPYDIAYTGEISLAGGVFAVGGVMEKLQAAGDSGCRKVFIPRQNYERLDKEKLDKLPCEVIPVTNVAQVVDEVFPDMDKK
ncbi:MAG: AAA family ATPase [Lachnospiraceae bacterium]|nr:AAA family ATPase [Lachnospiraceae bacterium]